MALDLRLAVTDLTPPGDMPLKIKCPDRIHKTLIGKTDKTNSLAVYPDHIHCFGCGEHKMGVWGLAAILGIPIEDARSQEGKYTSEALDAYRERVAVESEAAPLHPALADIYHEMLVSGPRSHRLDYLLDRGLDRETVDLAKLGHDGQKFTIPVYDDKGDLLTFRYRRDDLYYCTCGAVDEIGNLLPDREHEDSCAAKKHPKYVGLKGRNGFFLYPIPVCLSWYEEYPSGDSLVLCEGEFDALLVNQHYPALSPTNGAGQVHKVPAIVKEKWPFISHLIIATDQDEAGNEAARVTLEAAQELGFTAERLTWTAEAKDVTEYVKRFGKLPIG